MELLMRLPRGRRERTASQTTNTNAATSRPLPMKISLWKPASDDVSAATVAAVAGLDADGGLVGATSAGAGG